jgi:hypothetical protein
MWLSFTRCPSLLLISAGGLIETCCHFVCGRLRFRAGRLAIFSARSGFRTTPADGGGNDIAGFIRTTKSDRRCAAKK